MCPDVRAKQDCLNEHPLTVLGGTPSSPQPNDLRTRFYPRNGNGIYAVQARLPPGKHKTLFGFVLDFSLNSNVNFILGFFFVRIEGVEGGNCVLQWRYVAGNNWGVCSNGKGALGCGPQEEFRACADITIGTPH